MGKWPDSNPAKVQTAARTTGYQRVLVNQAIAANGLISTVINVGIGTKAVFAGFFATASAYVAIYPCDANGVRLSSGVALVTSASATNAGCVAQEIGGSPYVAIYVEDKSGAANTCDYVDVFWTAS